MSDADTAATLYGGTEIYQSATRALEQAHLATLATPEQAKASAQELPQLAQRYGLNATEAEAFGDAMATAARGKVTEEQVQGWTTRSEEHLRQEYGDSAGQVLADTRKLIQSDAKLLAKLKSTGLGSHPSVVAALARRAVEARKAGKLK